MTVSRFQGKQEWGQLLLDKSVQKMLDLALREQVTLTVTTMLRIPYHDTVLVDVWQVKAVALQQCAGRMQGSAGGDGIGDTIGLQQLQRIARVIRDDRLLVEQRAVQIKDNEVHRRALPVVATPAQ